MSVLPITGRMPSCTLKIKLAGHFAEFVIPFLAKPTNQRFLQELVNTHVQRLPLFHSIVADGPTVIVEPCRPVAERLLPNRIQCTTDGLDKVRRLLDVGLLLVAIHLFQHT